MFKLITVECGVFPLQGVSRQFIRYQTKTTSGILGTNRLQSCDSGSTTIALADPYLVYQELLRSKEIDKDPFQLALVKKLRVVANELKSYKPDLTSVKINRLVRELEIRYNKQQHDDKGVIFGYTIGWYLERENTKLRTELVKVLNDYVF